MPRILYNENSEEVEVLTEEEVTQLKAQAEKTAELEKEALESREKLEAIEQKDNKKKYDYDNLRRTISDKDKIIEGLKKEDTSEADKKILEERLDEANKAIEKYTEIEQRYAQDQKIREDRETKRITDHKEERIKHLSNGDEELEKKLRNEYDKVAIEEMSKDSVDERIERAFSFVTGNRPPRSTPPIGGSSGAYDPQDFDKKEFVETQKGRESYEAMFPQFKKEKKKE